MARMSSWIAVSMSIVLLELTGMRLLAAELQRDPAEYFFQDTFGDFAEELQNTKGMVILMGV